jgi:hypothetical protein
MIDSLVDAISDKGKPMDVVAERRLLALFPDGASVPVCLRVGRPRPHPLGDWVCPVQAEGLRIWEGPSEFFGVGSWQALMIGLRFLREMLAAEMDKGAVFHWEDGEHAISLEELFSLHKIE